MKVKKFIRRCSLGLLSALLCLSCCGCLFVTSADDLYSLPKGSEEYVELQEQISAILDSGVEYSAPLTGNYRQAVHLRDLDGDGVDEAVGCFIHEGEKPLMIIIFKKTDGDYEKAAVIEGDGRAIDSVSYVDMDGDGIQEMVVGWQMSVSVKLLSVYSLRNFQVTELTETDYVKYSQADLDETPGTDLIVFRLSQEEMMGEMIRYSLLSDGELVIASARLSDGVTAINAVRTGFTSDKRRGVFVDSGYTDGGVITDVFTVVDGDKLINLTLDPDRSISAGTLRYNTSLYCSDLNGDGVVEIPHPRELISQTETVYRVVDWLGVTDQGVSDPEYTTFHNISDSWYLVLPSSWAENLSVRRQDQVAGERTIVFSAVEGLEDELHVTDLVAITLLSGDNRQGRAKLRDRFILYDTGEVIYTGRILTDRSDMSVTKEYILKNFNLIYTDWNA